MDYERVYREFIADRRAKEAELVVFEVHHILPRSLGGNNEASNLIRLSLSDHLFAHRLLAAIHEGPMAVAFVNMLAFKRYKGRRSRNDYARLKEASRQYLSTIFTGRSASDEARQNMRRGQLARCADPEARAARDTALYSPQAVEKAKAGGRAYWEDEQRREAMKGNTHSTGRVLSELHKARIGAATRAYHQRRRAAEQGQ